MCLRDRLPDWFSVAYVLHHCSFLEPVAPSMITKDFWEVGIDTMEEIRNVHHKTFLDLMIDRLENFILGEDL